MCRVAETFYGRPADVPAAYAQCQYSHITMALYQHITAERGKAGLACPAMGCKALQNVAKALIDLHHYELALGYAHAAVQLSMGAIKACYFAALAAFNLGCATAAMALLLEVRRSSQLF